MPHHSLAPSGRSHLCSVGQQVLRDITACAHTAWRMFGYHVHADVSWFVVCVSMCNEQQPDQHCATTANRPVMHVPGLNSVPVHNTGAFHIHHRRVITTAELTDTPDAY